MGRKNLVFPMAFPKNLNPKWKKVQSQNMMVKDGVKKCKTISIKMARI